MCGPCVQCLKIILLQKLKPLSWVRVSRSGLSDSIMKVGRQAHCCWADICRAVQVSRKYQCVSFGKWGQQVVKLQPKILSVFQMCQCVKHLDINQNYHQQQQWSVLGKIDGLVWYTVPFMCSCYHWSIVRTMRDFLALHQPTVGTWDAFIIESDQKESPQWICLLVDMLHTNCRCWSNVNGEMIIKCGYFYSYNINWLVVSTPLKNMSSSVGIIIPNMWENKSHVPNHQRVKCLSCVIMIIKWFLMGVPDVPTRPWLGISDVPLEFCVLRTYELMWVKQW